MHFYRQLCLFAILMFTAACNLQDTDSGTSGGTPVAIERNQLLADIQYLSSDALAGRRVGTAGNRLAQTYIEERFDAIGLEPFGATYRQSFSHRDTGTGGTVEAVNLAGYVEGRNHPDRFIVVMAHYDHLGTNNGDIYNGADDNASGTAGLMATAEWFSDNPPSNSILFVAFDAEEQGLAGASHFVENPPLSLAEIKLAVNMDMIATNFDNELYAVGTYHYPWLRPMIEQSLADSPVTVLFGHDNPDNSAQDWTLASDHGPFHEQGVPFTYFGVEDHPHYHQPTDTFETINVEFFYQSVLAITGFVNDMDTRLDEVVAASGR